MQQVVAVILGGGKGTRLFPLTKERSKPAVPIAGKYRLIDIPISNCIHSGIRAMHVLTMYQSASLNSHISHAYRFDNFSRGYVEINAAEQTAQGGTWFQGTADAVRQAWAHITGQPSENVLILSGDHLYTMDYSEFLGVHKNASADFSIAVQPVSRAEAPELGLLKTDETGRIVQFAEKPKTDAELDAMMVDTTSFGLTEKEAKEKPFLASMGIYLAKTGVLNEMLLRDPTQTDFGKDIIPDAIQERHVQAYCFQGYWADIGTVGAFFEANLDLVRPEPQFNLFDPDRPLYTNARYLPGVKLIRASVEGSLLADGTIIEGAMVRDSILGVRSRIRPGATIERCYVMGNDYFDPEGINSSGPLGIGEGAYLRNAIIDKNASIGRGVQLVNRDKLDTYDDPEDRFYVRDGIILVAKGAALPEGFVF